MGDQSAFPVTYPMSQQGMTLRDWFAGQALLGYAANPNVGWHITSVKSMAKGFFDMADAMIKERDRNG